MDPRRRRTSRCGARQGPRHTPGRRPAGPAAGFTLIELLVVLAIATLLIGVAVPLTIYRRDHDKLVASAHEIALALRSTRSRAILADRPASFVIDTEAGSYRPAGARAVTTLPSGNHIALFTAENEALSDSTGAIRFFPDGSSTGGAIELSRGKESYQVAVDWLTGRISIRERGDASRR